MTAFKAWIPPPGVGVVEPPVHPETRVDVIYSDGDMTDTGGRAGSINWSAVGDGPSIVAYAVVSEYKPAPKPPKARDFWITLYDGMAWDREWQAVKQNATFLYGGNDIIHVREVLPAAREVVAWAVVGGDGDFTLRRVEAHARDMADTYGGTVVRLSGVLPNE